MNMDIMRTGLETAAYSETVTIPATSSLTYVSGILADLSDIEVPPGTVSSYGDTKTQTLSVFNKINKILQARNLSMADIIQIRVFLVGTVEFDGKLDFSGFQQGYNMFFGSSDQPNKPTRTAVQVVALPLPGTLVEVDVIAVGR
ncbi:MULTISPECIES: RidA family protein [Pseudomonas]|jgi:enamine deaminase RidA (YjgF/YER057c/UK114 family)|uniref:RidA family protein n=1 Tax=Pseudomonas sp. MIL9 TaxID=2807620 RepID=UPI0019527293|nr:RidA family protein [Pseudomonas sp. MIL9]MBM6447035.1 RidA family protein [Pseudomonas sp. MIL9]